jgi:GNAT superfamily N-acetyltransferase
MIAPASPPTLYAVPASRYTYEELAQIYEAGRVDYIVPLPMNMRRMKDYIYTYDIDLERSVVAVNANGDPVGLGMLGWRSGRGWITRLGVNPDQRQHGVGRFIVESLLQIAAERSARSVQLEVIEGNDPAYRLFSKLGFASTRSLWVLSRAPTLPETLPALDAAAIESMDATACMLALSRRDQPVSWHEEAESMCKVGMLDGLRLTWADGMEGAILFCRLLYKPRALPMIKEMSHITLIAPPDADETRLRAILTAAHRAYPDYDTKLENLDFTSRFVPIFNALGYYETFKRKRIEMIYRFNG